MTGYFVKAAAMALAVAVLAGLLKGRQASLAAALTLGGCAALVYFAALLLQPVRNFCSELAQTAGVAEAYLHPVLKCTGIALLTELCAALCRDAGQSALANAVELCGSALVIVLSLPLLTALLALLRSWMGG